MPPLTLLKPAGGAVFLSHGLKLPSQFQPAQGDPAQDHYKKAWKPEDKVAVPQLVPPWFMPAESGNKYYQDSCDRVGNDFKQFHDTMLDAVAYAHNMWRLQAKFQGLVIAAVSAVGKPGCLDGPELESNIKNAPMCMAFTGNKAKHRDAVAKGVSKCFKDWQDKVTVPGLPWYPLFAAFPGPMAPPTPNVPTPLAACVSPMMTSIVTPMQMKSAMSDALDGDLKRQDKDKQYEALHDAIATVLAAAFATWLPAQQVIGVMGKGPIPTFAPPYVPLGPVVGGDNLALPGHLAV
jgi:hypothetical protein